MSEQPEQVPPDQVLPDHGHGNMSLVEHLIELKSCVVRALYGIVLATSACFYFSDRLFAAIRAPIVPYLPSGGLVYTAPIDKFMAHLKVSMLAGLILSAPWWFYQVWRFISPGLYMKERRYALTFISVGSVFFVMGCAFAYYLALPAAFDFLFNFGGTEDKPMITISEYLSFLVITILMFGVSFEIPLIITMLGIMGVVDSKFLRTKRRYAVVVLAILSAVMTPPDAVSMLLMLVPMMIFYEVAILVVAYFERKKAKKESAE